MKTIVTLVSVANHGPNPLAIYGANGRAYGHAKFDPTRNRHVIELPYDEYLKVGPYIAANATNAFNQWFAEFRMEDGGENPVALRAQLDEVTGQRDSLQKRIDDLTAEQIKRAPLTAAPTDSATANAPARTLDSAVAVLRIARDLPALAEDKIVTLPDGTLDKQHQEIHPVQVGSPTEDHFADSQTGKTTTREQVAPGVEVITEHEKVDAETGEPTLADSIRAHAGSAAIENQAASTQSAAIAADGNAAAVVPTPTPNETEAVQKDIGSIQDFRALRAIAQEEGVPDVESHTTAEDMRAAIVLHREEKAKPAAE